MPLDVVLEETFLNNEHFPWTLFTWPSEKPIGDVNGPMPSSLRLETLPKVVNFYFFHSSTTKWALVVEELIDFSSPSIDYHYMVPKWSYDNCFLFSLPLFQTFTQANLTHICNRSPHFASTNFKKDGLLLNYFLPKSCV
jgi:hypothetical protein